MSSAITVTALGVIVNAGNTDSVVLGLYADSAGVPGALVAYSPGTTVNAGPQEIPVNTKVQIAAGKYWVAGLYSGYGHPCTEQASYVTYDYVSAPYGSPPPNPFGTATSSNSIHQIAYYVVGY